MRVRPFDTSEIGLIFADTIEVILPPADMFKNGHIPFSLST